MILLRPLTILLIVFGCTSTTEPTPTSSTVAPSEANLKAAWEYCQQSNSYSMIVMHNGRTIFEQYANGSSANTPQRLASGSKSFNGVLAVAAVEDNLIRLDDRVANVVTEWKDD